MSDAAEIQAHLKGAIQRASRAGDLDVANRIREDGRRMVFLLTGLIRASRVYSPENAALDTPSRELVVILEGLLHILGSVRFVLVDDQIYMNDVRIRVRAAEQPVVDSFTAELAKHGVGGISIHFALDAPQIRELAMIIAGPPEASAPRRAIAQRLVSAGDIQVTGRWRFRLGTDSAELEQGLDDTVVSTAAVLSDALMSVGAGRIVSTLSIRRLVIPMVDALKRRPSAAAAIPFRHRGLRVAERHLVSVAGLAILIGSALQLEDATLADLAVAALLHDVGYAIAPVAERHAGAGARILMRQRGFHEAKVRRFLAVLEHHRPLFSRDSREPPPTLFARIIRLADDYDVMVSPRPHQVPPLPPPQALAVLWGGRGRSYDPVLTSLFAGALGRYPPGTLFELSDWSWAVSVSEARTEEQFRTPVVRTVRDPDGNALDGSREIDLWAKRAHLSIRRVVDPALSGFDVGPILDLAFGD